MGILLLVLFLFNFNVVLGACEQNTTNSTNSTTTNKRYMNASVLSFATVANKVIDDNCTISQLDHNQLFWFHCENQTNASLINVFSNGTKFVKPIENSLINHSNSFTAHMNENSFYLFDNDHEQVLQFTIKGPDAVTKVIGSTRVSNLTMTNMYTNAMLDPWKFLS